jgi:hypothetical protein
MFALGLFVISQSPVPSDADWLGLMNIVKGHSMR